MSDMWFGERLQISAWEEWSEIFSLLTAKDNQNWYGFTPIRIEFEHSPYKGSTEATIFILGVGGCIRFVWNTHALDDVKALRDEFLAEHPPDEQDS